MTAIVHGRSGLREFFARLLRWRVGIKMVPRLHSSRPLLICLHRRRRSRFASCHLRQFPVLTPRQLREVPERFLFILLFIGLGQKQVRRGFALPQLQRKYSPLIASLILASGLDALASALDRKRISRADCRSVRPLGFRRHLLGLTWLFNGTKGSVLLPMLFHATINTVGAGLIFPLFSGESLILLWWTYGFVWLCAGLSMLLYRSHRQGHGAAAPAVSIVGAGRVADAPSDAG